MEVKNINIIIDEYDARLAKANRENVLLTTLCKELQMEVEQLKKEIEELKNKYEGEPVDTNGNVNKKHK